MYLMRFGTVFLHTAKTKRFSWFPTRGATVEPAADPAGGELARLQNHVFQCVLAWFPEAAATRR